MSSFSSDLHSSWSPASSESGGGGGWQGDSEGTASLRVRRMGGVAVIKIVINIPDIYWVPTECPVLSKHHFF